MEITARSVLGSAFRWLYYAIAAGLFAHFLFLLALVGRVSIAAVVLFGAAGLFAVPWTRRWLAERPLLRWGWLRGCLCLALIACANSLLQTGDRPQIVHSDYAFVGATLITGHRDADPIRNGVVLVGENGRIIDVGDTSTLPVPDGFEVVDLSGKFLVPGLINAHGHLMLPGRVPGEPMSLSRFVLPAWVANAIFAFMKTYPGEQLLIWQMEKNARLALRSGVTTLRGLGDPNYVDVAVRKRIEADLSLGPRLLVAGPILCVTGGHANQIGQVFDGPDQARRAVRNSLRHEVDLIKIANTGGVSDSRRIGEAGELQMTPEEIFAVVDEAHRKNVLVAAHAESAQGVLEALRAGVDNIEHGAELDGEAIRLFKNNPNALRGYTTLHPTLSVIADELPMNDAIRNDPVQYVMSVNGNEIRGRMIRGFETAIASGVKIGVGTDAGIVDHASAWREMQYFVDIGGVSNRVAIHMGTLATAESIGVDDITGSIDRGKYADFVVLDDDPFQDLSTFASPAMVIASGMIVN